MTTNPDSLVPHEYGPSFVGHGEAQCKWCFGTNRENAIIAPNHCEARAKVFAATPQPDPPESLLAVTPEMADAFAEWEAPDLPDFPVKHAAFLGWVRTAFMSGFAAAQATRPAHPAQPGREEVVEAIGRAYIAGATAVHEYWTDNPGEAPRGDPEFGEAASDYAHDAAEPLLARQDVRPEAEDLTEKVARIIDPSSWAVMDSYLEQTKRKYAGQNVGWPEDQFKHKESMAKAREILSTLPTVREENARLREALKYCAGAPLSGWTIAQGIARAALSTEEPKL